MILGAYVKNEFSVYIFDPSTKRDIFLSVVK